MSREKPPYNVSESQKMSRPREVFFTGRKGVSAEDFAAGQTTPTERYQQFR